MFCVRKNLDSLINTGVQSRVVIKPSYTLPPLWATRSICVNQAGELFHSVKVIIGIRSMRRRVPLVIEEPFQPSVVFSEERLRSMVAALMVLSLIATLFEILKS